MRKIDEKTDKDKSVFSYERMRFRYEWIKKYYDDGMILDIGCGDGFGAEYFNKKKYTGIDYNYESIQTACKSYPEAKFKTSIVPPLEFPDDYFDYVLCLELIEHLDSKNAPLLLNEIYRVMKKKGMMFLTTPNVSNRGVMPLGHFIEYSIKEMKKMLESAGFKIYYRGGLWISIYKNRYKENGFFRFRKIIFEAISNKNDDVSNFSTFNNRKILKSLRILSDALKLGVRIFLVCIAKIINYLGYFFPGKAEYQVWFVKK